MASSEVEIVSSSPFGCVLREHNRKERCRESNVRVVQAVFDNNFKDLVRDHINGHISLSSSSNLRKQITHVASWVTNEQGSGNRHNLRSLKNGHHKHNNNNNNYIQNEEPLAITPKHSPVLDRKVTRQAKDVTVSTIQKLVNQTSDSESLQEVPSNSNTASPTTSMVSSTSKTKDTENISAKMENNTKVTHNLGASSLVQIWEARLNRSNSMNSNHNQSQSQNMGSSSNTSRANSGLDSNDNINNATSMEEASTTCDPCDEKFESGTQNDDSFINWDAQSDRTAVSEPPPSSSLYSKSYDSGESERVRIADIIKRLKNGREVRDDHDSSSTNNMVSESSHKLSSSALSDQAEQRYLSYVVSSPRLRGRQAFNDLLMQIERDKNRELDSLNQRQAVSKFSQRGRLQSMLRLRCLQRSVTIQEKCLPQSPKAHVNRLPQPQGSNILHLKEKFSNGGDQQNDPATPRCHHKDVLNNSTQSKKSSTTSKPQSEDMVSCSEQHKTWSINCFKLTKEYEVVHEQAMPTSDATQHMTRFQAQCVESLNSSTELTTTLESQSQKEILAKELIGSNIQQQQEEQIKQQTSKTISYLNVYSKQNEVKEEEEANHQQHLYVNLQETRETTTSSYEKGEKQVAGKQQHLCLDSLKMVEDSTFYSDQDENEVIEEMEEDYFVQTNDHWFRNISRPRSYWEDLRKAWYKEVLNTTSKDEEIRQLLERGRVSSFLASDFRERMDQLMISRVHMQANQAESEEEVDDEDRTVQIMSYLQRYSHPTAGGQGEGEGKGESYGVQDVDIGKEEEYDDDDDDDDDGERSLTICHEGDEGNNNHWSSCIQRERESPSSSPSQLMRSWSFQDDNETGNYDSDRVLSTYSPCPKSQYNREDNIQYSSSSMRCSNPSLEMEVICEIRGQMEQLQREISELRKSIVSCMDMHMKFQQFTFTHHHYHQQLHSVGVGSEEGKISEEREASPCTWRRNCCICHEMQVDSVLYRCGHMCTCVKCGHELQWRSGKCPICRAPILDVVPTK